MTTDPLKIAIKGSTQDHLPIEDIVDGVVIMKDGSCASIMQISSVNFDLLSEKEQSALVAAYGGILNSLNFPIQIVVKSSTKDVGVYLKRLLEAEKKQTNKLLKERIKNYRKFIDETVKKNDVLSKTFYIVIKFSSLELGIKTAGVQTITNLFNKKVTSLPYPKAEILEKAKAKNVAIHLPEDSVIADKFDAASNTDIRPSDAIPDGWMGLDIGPKATGIFSEIINKSKTILWNGPVGVFEFDNFSNGTFMVADAVVKATEKGAFSLEGGGDTISSINKFKLADKFNYVSTAGGAMLEFCEGRQLPGIRSILED